MKVPVGTLLFAVKLSHSILVALVPMKVPNVGRAPVTVTCGALYCVLPAVLSWV
ncbi:hypothetical protein D3C86_2129010 [compost metagenome]